MEETEAEASSESDDVPLPGEMDDDGTSSDSALVESEPDSAVSSGDVHSLPAELSEAEGDPGNGSDPDSGMPCFQRGTLGWHLLAKAISPCIVWPG